MKVLIVDDNFSDRTGIHDLVNWRELGIDEVFCATNGQEGYEMAQKINPALVLTDVSMPIMNGIKMAEKISELYPQTKFIFFSCFDDVEYLTAAIETRAYGYLLKPIDIRQLEQAIAKVLALKKIEQEQKEEITILKSRLIEYTPVVQTALLRDFLTGSVQTLEYREIFDFYEPGYFAVAILCMNELDGNYARIYEINDFVARLSGENEKISTFVLGSNCLVAVVSIRGRTDEIQRIDATLEFFRSIRETLQEKSNAEVDICIGGITEQFRQLPALFRSCEYAFKSGYIYSGITFAEEVGKQPSGFDCDLSELKTRITRMIDSSDFKELDLFIEEYYSEQAFNTSYTPQIFGFVVLSILQMVLSEKNESFSNIFGDENLLWNKLQNYQSIYNVKNWMYNIFKSIMEFTKQQNSNQSNHQVLVSKIKQMISENLCEIETVSQVTKRLYISTSYANHIFKLQEGKTIFEYLSEMKLEMAKKMLRSDELKIYEIADRLGYKTNSYFGMAFKEKVGMTPKKYRDTYGTKKE